MGWNRLEEWLAGPCISCEGSSPEDQHHVGMPVSRPSYVDPFLETLTGPGEQHQADPNSHCVNPKCDYHFTSEDESQIERDKGWFRCPKCGYEYDYLASAKNPTYTDWASGDGEGEQAQRSRPANPGGITRSGLTLEQMGRIGETIILRMGELPGIGAITPASAEYNFPIDAIVESPRGKFGCEIKTNHSEAQARFKIGGKTERQEKITYCLTHGLKPALLGVRLNFYTDKAYVFFREGLTDTWIGNAKMIHVTTLDFSDLNPFQSPDPEAQALAVDNAHLPDQSEEPDAGLDEIFGAKAATMTASYTIPQDVHELKIVDKQGKHTHTVRRCMHCGSPNYVPSEHRSRIECSTCGQDPDRHLTLAKIAVTNADAADDAAREAGWGFAGWTDRGNRIYHHSAADGVYHRVLLGVNPHPRGDINGQFLRQRISRCMNGMCMHGPSTSPIPVVAEPRSPVLRMGGVVDAEVVPSHDGSFALVQDLNNTATDVAPAQHLLNQVATGT